MVLDIGCGKKKVEAGAIGIDMSPESAAEHVWNLEDAMRAMAEVWRVARDGADVFVVTPHFSSHNSYVDPTHRRHLAAASFEYFTGRDFPTFAGSPCRFDIVAVELTFGGNFLLDNLGRFLARRSIRWYERHAAWVFPALDIRAHLRARKR